MKTRFQLMLHRRGPATCLVAWAGLCGGLACGNTENGGTGASSTTSGAGGAAGATSSAAADGGSSASTSTTAGGTTGAGGMSTTTGDAGMTSGSGAMGGAGGTEDTGGAGGTSDGGAGGSEGGTGPGFVSCPYEPPELPNPIPDDWVAGDVVQFNDNGAWTWYSDERAVVDAENGKIIVGSDASGDGGGGGRNGQVEAVIYDVATGAMDRTVLGTLQPDDHNTPALLVQPGGRYVAFWAGHNENCNSYWRNYSGTAWGAQQNFPWDSLGCPWGSTPRSITYNNLWYMTAENKIYNFVRSIDTSPNVLISEDDGASWQYGGRLSSTPQIGYVAGYYKYWGNGVDRIDFVGTEAHPRDNDNSLYHGYVKGGATYDSFDNSQDADISDDNSPDITDFTTVFQTGDSVAGVSLNHLWNIDLQRYDDGTIALLWTGRADNNTDNPDHRILYSRFDGTSWSHTYLVRGGPKLYDSEQDYIGLGALHPNDPRIIYVSTPIDPRDDSTNLGQHEVFMGVTCDDGATFTFTPITMNSSKQNLRPIVPKWDGNNMVLLWFRGAYRSAQDYDEEVVGIVTTDP